jgi:hypothetical protein
MLQDVEELVVQGGVVGAAACQNQMTPTESSHTRER